MRQREQFEIAVSEVEAVRGVLSFDEAEPSAPAVALLHHRVWHCAPMWGSLYTMPDIFTGANGQRGLYI